MTDPWRHDGETVTAQKTTPPRIQKITPTRQGSLHLWIISLSKTKKTQIRQKCIISANVKQIKSCKKQLKHIYIYIYIYKRPPPKSCNTCFDNQPNKLMTNMQTPMTKLMNN